MAGRPRPRPRARARLGRRHGLVAHGPGRYTDRRTGRRLARPEVLSEDLL